MTPLKTLLWMLGCLLTLELPTKIACDYSTLLKCGLQESCWPRLDAEIVTVIRNNIRNSSNPCDNFWNYACGDWKTPNEIQQNHSDNFGYQMDNYVNSMQELLLPAEKKTLNINGIENLIGKLSTYYQSCIGIKTKHPDLVPYLTELPLEQGEQWPDWKSVIESKTWNQNSNFNWLKAIAKLRRYGLNGIIIEERATVAFNDSTKNVIELKMPDEDQNFEKKFELVHYFVHFGFVDGFTDEIWNLAEKIFELENQLKELRKKHSRDDDATFEEALTLSQLKEKVPSIDWQSYLNILLEKDHVNSELPIEVNGIGYLREVSALLVQTDDKTIALYILMHLCKYIYDMRPQTDNQHCLNHMNTLMPLGLNYIYDRFIYETRHNDEQALQTIFNQLKRQFHQYIIANKLQLNEVEQNYLKQKVDKMMLRLGNLPRDLSVDYYNQYYDAVNITENFYHNHWEMLRFRTLQQHRSFLQNEAHLNLDTFYVYDDIDQMRNAPYFVHERNLLIVPMIFMKLPFFHYSLQPLFQYSLVGFILGHEFNHAFENYGIIMDADGNESSIGFDIKRKKEFISNVKCFQQTKTASLVERMADVNGFQLVYDAYFGNVVGNNVKRSVETLDFLEDFNEKQLFFLNFAQFFCGELPEPIDHDSDDVRVNEIVRDMPEFQEAFQCNNEKVPSTRDEICKMWRA